VPALAIVGARRIDVQPSVNQRGRHNVESASTKVVPGAQARTDHRVGGGGGGLRLCMQQLDDRLELEWEFD
jgi:hypothetical protein